MRGADSDAPAMVSVDEHRVASASRPAERQDESWRALKRMPSQCVFRRGARPCARPRGTIRPIARVFVVFFRRLRYHDVRAASQSRKFIGSGRMGKHSGRSVKAILAPMTQEQPNLRSGKGKKQYFG